MGTYTTNYNLFMPSVGETGWGTLVNTNFSTIDTTMKSLSNRITAVENEVNGALSCTSVTTSGRATVNGGITSTTGTFSGAVTATSFNGLNIGKNVVTVISVSAGAWYQPDGSNTSTTTYGQYNYEILPLHFNTLYTGTLQLDSLGSTWPARVSVINENNSITYYIISDTTTINFNRVKAIHGWWTAWSLKTKLFTIPIFTV